ncbi:MAG: CGNR zinc finger domain-containing protein [Acidimicrobiales bacterium]
MQVTSVSQSEVRLTLDTAIDVVNDEAEPGFDLRQVLVAAGFSRAGDASQASIDRLGRRFHDGLAHLLRALPDSDAAVAIVRVNEELTELRVAPSIVDHDSVGPHLHWTPPTATFDDQVVTDVLMALAQELCDHGIDRFGRCAAEGCDRIFFDTTRNGSRRFCSDPRCASRTHTADHRARQRSG